MIAAKAQTKTIKQIKIEAKQQAKALAVPEFWLTDWLLYVIDKPTLFLMTDEDYQLSETELKHFNAGVIQMQQGTPLAYLTGQQAFWSLNFKVNAHTLIPRPDTEILVEQVLAWIAQQSFDNKNKRLLDLGTGSGCIVISLAHELTSKNWQFVAVDYSQEALEIARYNAMVNHLPYIEWVKSSWYDELSTDISQQFDVIVSNPPYIDESDEHLQALKAEPISALSAPNKGLADIEHIVQHAPNYLRSGGLLAIEHGYNQGLAVRSVFLARGFKSVATVQDYGGNDRVTLGQLS